MRYVDTLAEIYLSQTSVTVVAAIELACKRKHKKCTKIKSSPCIFKALAFENLLPWTEESLNFTNRIGTLIVIALVGFFITI